MQSHIATIMLNQNGSKDTGKHEMVKKDKVKRHGIKTFEKSPHKNGTDMFRIMTNNNNQ